MRAFIKRIKNRAFPFGSFKSRRFHPFIAFPNGGSALGTPRRYDRLSEEGYLKNVIVYRAISLITRGAASVPWQLYNGVQELSKHPLLDLLHHPNPHQGGSAFIETILAYKLLAGNSYIEMVCGKNGAPFELYPLRPDRVHIIPGNNSLPQGYEYRLHDSARYIAANPLTGASTLLHLKMFHPLNDWHGMSPLEAAACALDQHNAVSAHNLHLLQNGGRPSGALKINSRQANSSSLTLEQRDSLRAELRTAYEGSRNAGRVLVFEGDCEWQEMGLSLKDLDFIDGKLLSAREIAQAYGVPPMLVGVPGDATFSNYREARYHLWEDTIIPLLDYLCDEFNHWLVPRFDPRLTLAFKLDGIPALAPRREMTWKRINEATFLTLNEKRDALGYKPMPGGDILLPSSDIKNKVEEDNAH
jgi:HK97 family phage portal protein